MVELGIHAALRAPFRKDWEFESPPVHQWPPSPIGRGVGFKIRRFWVRIPGWLPCKEAEVVELVYTRDLKSRALGIKGSNPFFGTKDNARMAELGIRTGFRFQRLRDWGFDSPSAHHTTRRGRLMIGQQVANLWVSQPSRFESSSLRHRKSGRVGESQQS